jgi:8-oxo-dGTP diphosphatase
MYLVKNNRKGVSVLNYTLCFLIKGSDVLMLFREKNPNRGKWNGVGGKIELSETGLHVGSLLFRGMITLNGVECIYVFISDDFAGELIQSDEGALDWKSVDWILESRDVVENIPLFINEVLDRYSEPKVYDCSYGENGEMNNFHSKPYSKLLRI